MASADVRLGSGPEFDRIRLLLQAAGRPATDRIRIGPGDDCAVLMTGDLALSTDLTLEGVHYRSGWIAPEDVGFRATTAALSDLAAVAAEPIGVLVSLAVPTGMGDGDIRALGRGIGAACERVGGALFGGDLTGSPQGVVIDVVAVGLAPDPVSRSGARPGDELWVTGVLGASAAAVAEWRRGRTPSPPLVAAFARPPARVAEARWLRQNVGLTALIDLSDGLLGDAGHLAAASGVALTVEGFRVPVHPEARRTLGPDEALAAALGGGEDYELCFTAAPGAVDAHAKEFFDRFGVGLTRVGTATRGSGVYLRRQPAGAVTEVSPGGGFDHFEREADG